MGRTNIFQAASFPQYLREALFRYKGKYLCCVVGYSPVVRSDSINCLVCLIDKTVLRGYSSSLRSVPFLREGDQYVLFCPSYFYKI